MLSPRSSPDLDRSVQFILQQHLGQLSADVLTRPETAQDQVERKEQPYEQQSDMRQLLA
jgi:hypothetical protein